MTRDVTRAAKGQATKGQATQGQATQGQVRIIGGAWRSRMLRFPTVPGLRPTSDRVRETLFNGLGQDLTGKPCLDLFAGSGALGFEALSRNAKSVVMVECDARARAALSANAKLLQAGTRLAIDGSNALQFLRTCVARQEQRFDLIFCDPPFGEAWFDKGWPQLGMALAAALAEGGMLYTESGAPLQAPAPWRLVKSGKAGQVFYQLLEHPHAVAAPAQ